MSVILTARKRDSTSSTTFLALPYSHTLAMRMMCLCEVTDKFPVVVDMISILVVPFAFVRGLVCEVFSAS